MTFYDGGSNTSTMMGKYCGDSLPSWINIFGLTSSGYKILIQFQTDGHDDGNSGFKIEYKPSPYGKV